MEKCSAKAGSAQVRPCEPCRVEVGLLEVRPIKVGCEEVRLLEVRRGEVRCNVAIRFSPLIPSRNPLLQPCELFLVRHRSYFLRLLIDIEANLSYSVLCHTSVVGDVWITPPHTHAVEKTLLMPDTAHLSDQTDGPEHSDR